MKLTRDVWAPALGTTDPLYDVFVQIHASQSTSTNWHGTAFFLLAHKWFLWVYESAIIWTAYTNRVALGITEAEACAICLPYWDWIMDYDGIADNTCPVLEDNKSGIWDENAFGSAYVDPSTYYVVDGMPALDGWKTVVKTSSNWQYPDRQYANYDNHLKRELYCGPDGYNLNVGPSQAMKEITTRKAFKDYATWLEGAGHGVPHMFCGFSMSLMFSPDDPIFWLHHCNVDRLYAFWVDCQGFENIAAASITTAQYTPFVNKRGVYDTTPYAKSKEIPYKWNDATTILFPKDKTTGKWPTPQQLWPYGLPGSTGYDGINYRYGTDQLVRGYGKTCPNQVWSIVDPGYVATKKRDESIHPMIQEFKDIFESKVSEGKSHQEALHEMAMTECENAPKNEITPSLARWIEMNGLQPEQFDSICDKPSKRMSQARDREDKTATTLTARVPYLVSERMSLARDREDTTATTLTGSTTAVPLWVIIAASVGSAIVLIAVISLVIFFTIRRKPEEVVDNDDLYRQM
jgi:hypothetical protein